MAIYSISGDILNNLYAKVVQKYSTAPYPSARLTPYISLWDGTPTELGIVGGRILEPTTLGYNTRINSMETSYWTTGEMADSGTVSYVGIGIATTGTPEVLVSIASPQVVTAGDNFTLRDTPNIGVVGGTGVEFISDIGLGQTLISGQVGAFGEILTQYMGLIDVNGDEITGGYYRRQIINNTIDFMEYPGTAGAGSSLEEVVFAGLPAMTVHGLLIEAYYGGPDPPDPLMWYTVQFPSPIVVPSMGEIRFAVGDFSIALTI